MADEKDFLVAARKAGLNSNLVICVARGDAFRHCRNVLTLKGSVFSEGRTVSGVNTVIMAVVTGASPEDLESKIASLLQELIDKGAEKVIALAVEMLVSIPGA